MSLRTPKNILLIAVAFNFALTIMLLHNQNGENHFDPVDYWSNIDFDLLTASQLMQYFLWTNRSSCGLIQDFGGKMLPTDKDMAAYDGQKAVCLDRKVAPNAQNCLVYSFGINNEWSFDEAMENYGCQVYAFDPSMDIDDHNHTENIFFYNLGLGSKAELDEDSWQMKTLLSIYQMLQNRHGKASIDYLKIDIEADEWSALPQIIQSGMLNNVRQMGVEIHLPKTNATLKNYRNLAKIVRSLENDGMVRFDSKYNPWSPWNFTDIGFNDSSYCAYELAWYNQNNYNPKLGS